MVKHKRLHRYYSGRTVSIYPCFLIIAVLLIMLYAQASAVDISTYSFAGCNFPDTAQTGDYTATFGEDSDYQPAAAKPDYTIYTPVGISSVTVDNRTGLMWITNPMKDAGFNKPGVSTWEVAISSCEALNYAGYTDWRLPNVRELVSIVDYGVASPSINSNFFPDTPVSGMYWTATTYVPDTTKAWYVLFNAGSLGGVSKTGSNYVRCVRGGP